mgnify:CR=1 FL=1
MNATLSEMTTEASTLLAAALKSATLSGSFSPTALGARCGLNELQALAAARYSFPHTNSTALAAMALHAEGATAAATAATSWLAGPRSADGGFPFFGDPTQPRDGNSTGVVLDRKSVV